MCNFTKPGTLFWSKHLCIRDNAPVDIYFRFGIRFFRLTMVENGSRLGFVRFAFIPDETQQTDQIMLGFEKPSTQPTAIRPTVSVIASG
jgi:hypothetical protein